MPFAAVLGRASLVTVHGVLSSCGVWAPEHADSVIAVLGLSCSRACGVLVPWPEIKLTSLALESGLLTPGPLGKSLCQFIWFSQETEAPASGDIGVRSCGRRKRSMRLTPVL